MQKNDEAKLILEDGSSISGKLFGYHGSQAGEVVFNTAMTGYPESLTDPSYRGQILVLTYPLIGNYGVPDLTLTDGLPDFFESESIHIRGLIICDYSFKYNHWNAKKSLDTWLMENKVTGIYDIDTRALTKKLRENGSMLGKIVVAEDNPQFYDPNKDNLVAQVSPKEKRDFGNGQFRILLVDCGCKANIIRYLLKLDTTVIVVPYDYDFSSEDYDGLFISNGPGDPVICNSTINHLQKALTQDKPIFGICLGNQLLALAAGAKTYKLKYGHRSHNQPVLMAGTDRAFITSQNHGFAVDSSSIPDDWEPYFINLNDKSNEGIRHKSKPFFSSQFHPEASGGPTDTEFLFEQFIEIVKKYKSK
ncbi:MAG: glutamine-hydrolyzing carbamoyl-phosphate synthase small subunit [Candidatus Kapabacteria bacterium]|nr:glutamine-hydrolyzing carbamoyl-phosphate synthase small subunit [Candidatus Kapabacteria bacterium]